MKISVVGLGYVGLSISTLLSRYYEIVALDIDETKIYKVNNKITPLEDKYIKKYFKEYNLNLKATSNIKEAFDNAIYIMLCLPTDFNEKNQELDTIILEEYIKIITNEYKEATIIIKSTVPIGFTDEMKNKYNSNKIIFSPEFLREGKALYDNLYPSRIVIGETNDEAHVFCDILWKCIEKKDTKIMYMSSVEAESVKLFSNAYLALRVSFFNELDMFAQCKNLNVKNIIDGVCSDERIGNYYNNPSFGYGGYCLSKDVKQLSKYYNQFANSIINTIEKSNNIRKNFIASSIIKKKTKLVGIYRLNMKTDSDNIRNSSIIDIIEKLLENNIKIIIYEKYLPKDNKYYIYKEKDLNIFKEKADLIITNRIDDELSDVLYKVYSRDIYNNN